MIATLTDPRNRPVLLAVGLLLLSLPWGCSRTDRASSGTGANASANAATVAELTNRLKQLGRTDGAGQVDKACQSKAGGCDCLKIAAKQALEADLHAAALKLIDGGSQDCRAKPEMGGMRAEALARSGKSAEALTAAAEVLKRQAKEQHALYARAHAQYLQKNYPATETSAQAAVTAGRGAPAHLLIGLARYHTKNLPGAKVAFAAIVKLDPKNIDGRYNLALVAHRQNRYRDAREGYLAVLRLDPKHADSRYNLAVLTHAAGAKQEAQHHLRKLEQIAPKDPRVAKLKKALAAKPPPTAKPTGKPAPTAKPTTNKPPAPKPTMIR